MEVKMGQKNGEKTVENGQKDSIKDELSERYVGLKR